jgi:hypothetical protein
MDDLFSYPVKYPDAPGFAKGRDTSRRAAATVKEPGPNELKVLAALAASDMTDHEIAAHLQMPMCRTQPRRSTLTARGLVIDSGERRLTPYGKLAVVWRSISRGRSK